MFLLFLTNSIRELYVLHIVDVGLVTLVNFVFEVKFTSVKMLGVETHQEYSEMEVWQSFAVFHLNRFVTYLTQL